MVGLGECRFLVKNLKYNNSETSDIKKNIMIRNSVLISAQSTATYAANGWFKDTRNLYIFKCGSSYSSFTKMKIDAIYGIKY